jgi:L-ascorbate metabolism protein UlaG (beta-lactamase superfamily)
MQPSDHFDGVRFRNPSGGGPVGLLAVLRWKLKGGARGWPDRSERTSLPGGPVFPRKGNLAVTFLNHSSFLVQSEQGNFLTDPIFSERASPVSWAGPKRVRPPGIAFRDLPGIDVVLLSHDHYDHMDMPTLERLEERFHPLYVTSLGNRRNLERAGLRRVHELDWWEERDLGPEVRVQATPAQHFSARGLFDRNRTLWCGYLLRIGPRQIFFAGDTAYAGHFEQIYSRSGAVDLALLPIGAYEPRWLMSGVHMNPQEAVQAHLELHSRASIGMHFGTFQLTDEGIDQPIEDLGRALSAAGVPPHCFETLDFGESRELSMTGARD